MVKMISSVPFDECVECSVKELAESLGMDYITAQGLVKFLVDRKIATITRTRKAEGGKGKPTNIYAIPNCIQLTFYNEAAKAA